MLKKLLLGIAKTFGVLFVLFAVYGVWSMVRERDANAAATAFCERFPVGAPMAEVARAAANEGDKFLRVIKKERVLVGYIGMFPYSRHYCNVDGESDRVVKTRKYHQD